MSTSSIGTRMKEYLDQNGIKYNFVAEKANITKAAMSLILSGNRDIKILEYYRICKALNVPFEIFLEDAVDE